MHKKYAIYCLSGALAFSWLAGCVPDVVPAQKSHAQEKAKEEPPLGRAYNIDITNQLADPLDADYGYGKPQINSVRDSVAISTYNAPAAPATAPTPATSAASSR